MGLSTLCQAAETGGGGRPVTEGVERRGLVRVSVRVYHLSDQFGRDRCECYYLVTILFSHLLNIFTIHQRSSPVLSASGGIPGSHLVNEARICIIFRILLWLGVDLLERNHTGL